MKLAVKVVSRGGSWWRPIMRSVQVAASAPRYLSRASHTALCTNPVKQACGRSQPSASVSVDVRPAVRLRFSSTSFENAPSVSPPRRSASDSVNNGPVVRLSSRPRASRMPRHRVRRRRPRAAWVSSPRRRRGSRPRASRTHPHAAVALSYRLWFFAEPDRKGSVGPYLRGRCLQALKHDVSLRW